MIIECKVLELFSTSLGLITILGCEERFVPYIKMRFTDLLDNEWILSMCGMDKTQTVQNTYGSGFKMIFDCQLKSSTEKDLKVGDVLFAHV